MILKKEFITTLILAVMNLSCYAQHASSIISQMDKYRDYVYQKQNIYYTIDDMGKVVDVKMGESIPDSVQMEIIGFLKGLPKFYGTAGTRITYIFPSEEKTKKNEIQKTDFTPSDSSKIAVGFANVTGDSETGEVLHVRAVKGSKPTMSQTEEKKVFDVVEQMPSFPGGINALMGFLSTFIRYPNESERQGAEGRVILTFIVERDGSVTDVKVAYGCDYYLEKEAVRVVNMMPKWSPGKQNGSTVRVKYSLPVTFRLQ